jgi:hypothetical protein
VTESNLQTEVRERLKVLIGSRLSLANYAGDCRLFHFGEPSGSPPCGKYAIHLQCAWRLEGSEGILTGLGDWYEPEGTEVEVDEWRPEEGGSLQEAVLHALMADPPGSSRMIVNRTDHLVVTSVVSDRCGGFCIELSGGVRLSVFPTGSRGEAWRLLEPNADSEHFVVEGGVSRCD